MTDDEQHEAVKLVADYARGLGLYGVIIVSRLCDECGGLHDFEMVSSISEAPPGQSEPLPGQRRDAVVALLSDFAQLAEHGNGRVVPTLSGKH